MNAPDIFAQARPILSLLGSIAICAGVIDAANLANIPGAGIETAVLGFLVKHI